MSIEVEPIGVIRTPYTDWAPHQPVERDVEAGAFRLELSPDHAEALFKLDSFRYVYVLGFLHEVTGEPAVRVRPPWAGGVEVGLFASRSPSRPCPVGLSIVRLLRVDGHVVQTGPMDFFDGTPLLDVKPYLATLDARRDANDGWVEELDGHAHLLEHLRGVPHDHGDAAHHDHGHHHDDGHHHAHGHGHDHGHDHGHEHDDGHDKG